VTLWLDAHLSPALAAWLTAHCGVACMSVRDLGLRDAGDRQIFMAARDAGVVVVTKDADFVRLLEQLGPPPQVLWLTCGNTSNMRLRHLIADNWSEIRSLLSKGESLVELGDAFGNS
jgi:predicted nuclease of predicted toxin-antitoxin system